LTGQLWWKTRKILQSLESVFLMVRSWFSFFEHLLHQMLCHCHVYFSFNSNHISCFASLLELTVLPYTPYWILSTDYENSALVYSCTDVLRLFHVDFAWILGRTRSLPAVTVAHGKEVFSNNNIDVSRMILSRQQGCDKDL